MIVTVEQTRAYRNRGFVSMKSSHSLRRKWVPYVDVPLQTTSDNEIVTSAFRHKITLVSSSDISPDSFIETVDQIKNLKNSLNETYVMSTAFYTIAEK